MKIKKKVMQIGDSLGIVLDRLIIQTLNIKKGDIINIEVKK